MKYGGYSSYFKGSFFALIYEAAERQAQGRISFERGTNMKERYQLQGTCLIVQLPEELDHESGEQIKTDTERIMSENHVQSMIFDFGETRFMDSSGIGVIMSRYRALGLRKGCVAAARVNERIDKILHLSGMHKLISINEIDYE